MLNKIMKQISREDEKRKKQTGSDSPLLEMHPVKDPSDGSTLNLAVDKSGIVVFRDYTRVGCFQWEELSNIEQRERKFRLKFHDGRTVKFYFDHGKVCQDFFRVCVEKHKEVHSEC